MAWHAALTRLSCALTHPRRTIRTDVETFTSGAVTTVVCDKRLVCDHCGRTIREWLTDL